MTLNQFLKSNKNLFLKVNFSCLDVIATVAQRRWLYSFTHKIAGQESRKTIHRFRIRVLRDFSLAFALIPCKFARKISSKQNRNWLCDKQIWPIFYI